MRFGLFILAFFVIGGAMIVFGRGNAEITAQNFVKPPLDSVAMDGEALFVANCVACHGENALGSEQGPPLIHKIYEPGHHGDLSFLNAALNGVRAHHWRFGNMPPVEGITAEEVAKIVAYIRTLQRANGIF